jgi:hypothetical protein
MKVGFRLIVLAFFTLVLLKVPCVQATVIDFEGPGFQHGTKVTNQYSPFLTIWADNPNRDDPDYAIIFDTQSPFSTHDNDLKGPLWAGGNIAGLTDSEQELGNLLIIAENTVDMLPGSPDGRVDDPDDEASRPIAGSIWFDFATPVTSFGFDLVDVEGPVEYGADSGYFAAFYDDETNLLGKIGFGEFVNPSSQYYDSTVAYGNNTANRIEPITAADLGVTSFNVVEISFGGSAGLDNVNSTPVPEPATMLLLGTGLVGLVGFRKKFKK